MPASFLRIGHRGAAAYATENTLSSLQTAIACGVDMVEMDVRRTKDGQLVLSHDPWLHQGWRRLTVKRHRLAELRRVCLPGGEMLATLEEALQFTGQKAMVNLDLKEPGTEQAVVTLVEQLGLAKRVMVSSLSYRSLRRVKVCNGQIFTALSYPSPLLAWLFSSWVVRTIASWLGHKPLWPFFFLIRQVLPYRIKHGRTFAGIDAFMVRAPLITPRLVDAVHGQELKLYTWPADNIKDVTKLKQLGVDGIGSNRPDVLSLA